MTAKRNRFDEEGYSPKATLRVVYRPKTVLYHWTVINRRGSKNVLIDQFKTEEEAREYVRDRKAKYKGAYRDPGKRSGRRSSRKIKHACSKCRRSFRTANGKRGHSCSKRGVRRSQYASATTRRIRRVRGTAEYERKKAHATKHGKDFLKGKFTEGSAPVGYAFLWDIKHGWDNAKFLGYVKGDALSGGGSSDSGLKVGKRLFPGRKLAVTHFGEGT